MMITSSHPTSRIFEIPEILEQILLQTPAILLLSSCRLVRRSWNNLISTSPSLQTYLRSGGYHPGHPTSEYREVTPLARDIIALFWKQAQNHIYQPTGEELEAINAQLPPLEPKPSRDSGSSIERTKFFRGPEEPPLAASREFPALREQLLAIVNKFRRISQQVPLVSGPRTNGDGWLIHLATDCAVVSCSEDDIHSDSHLMEWFGKPSDTITMHETSSVNWFGESEMTVRPRYQPDPAAEDNAGSTVWSSVNQHAHQGTDIGRYPLLKTLMLIAALVYGHVPSVVRYLDEDWVDKVLPDGGWEFVGGNGTKMDCKITIIMRYLGSLDSMLEEQGAKSTVPWWEREQKTWNGIVDFSHYKNGEVSFTWDTFTGPPTKQVRVGSGREITRVDDIL